MTDARRRQPSTTGAVVFVIGFSAAGAVFLFLSIPLLWAVLATLGLAAVAARLVLDIRGNRAM